MKKALLTAMTLLLLAAAAAGQVPDSSGVVWGYVSGGDTLIHQELREIWVYPRRNQRTARFQRQYSRLTQRVKKVYPYARKANEMLTYYEPVYLSLKTEREKNRLMKKIEEELLAEYKDDLKKMSINDGKVLIKLIDRETGKSSFAIIREFRGGFSASFWQAIARIFGNNLKAEYDPYGEDVLIEEIVSLIEFGLI